MARPYITDVESNIQGGVKAKLGPKTLIIGPNRIGKSSIVRSVELALSGRASDVAGRDTLALDAELWTLAAADAEIARSTVVIDRGPHFSETASWELTRGKKSKRLGPSAVFPLRDVTKAILGNAETARKFFLSVASRITWEDVLAEIPAQFHKRLDPYKSADGAAGLLAAIEGTKKRVREINADVKAQRSMATVTAQGLPPPPSAAEVEQAKRASENATRAAQTVQARARLVGVEAEAHRVEEKLRALVEEGEALRAKAAALPRPTPLPAVVEHAIAVGDYMVGHGAEECAICGSKLTVGPAYMTDRVNRAKTKVAEALRISGEWRLVEDEIARVKAQAESLSKLAERIIEERNSLNAIIGDAPAEGPTGDYSTLVAVAAKWETIRAAEGRALELETEASIMAQLPALCSTAMERLLERARVSFEARVQKFLPASMRFGIDLKDGDRDVFRIGLRVEYHGEGRNEGLVLRTALSGAEWSTVTAALASAVAESTVTSPDSPVIVVPEDRDFDSNTLADVMEKFSAFDGQVIMTGTKPPARKIEGWTIIDLGVTNDQPWCAECEAWIAAGPCPHGIGKPAPRNNGDLFTT